MLLSKKDQYYKIISKYENENFFNGFKMFFQMFDSLRENAEGSCLIFISLLYLFIILCAFFGLIFPFMILYLIDLFISKKKYLLVILSIIDCISFIITVIGCKGKGHWFCLFNPYQWLFFMIIFDTILFTSDLVIFIKINDLKYYEKNDDFFFVLLMGFLGNVFYSFCFLAMHIKIGKKLIFLFNTLRTLETNVIKFCTLEYIKELKRNSEFNN